MRLAAARNLAKVWLLASIVAAAFGGAGWLLGGYRTASVFVFCALLAGLAVYAYADRALLGMLGAREYALAEDPLLRSTVDALSAKLGIRPPKLYLIPDPFPRALAAGRGPQGSALAVSTGFLGAMRPAGARAESRRPRADLGGPACRRARRDVPARRLARARTARRSRTGRGGVRPPSPLSQAGACCRPGGRRNLRVG